MENDADKAEMVREQIAAVAAMLVNRMAQSDKRLLKSGADIEYFGERLIAIGKKMGKKAS